MTHGGRPPAHPLLSIVLLIALWVGPASAFAPEASLWLARTLATLKRVDDALGILRRLLDRDPACLAAHAEIGRILLREHRDEESKKAFEELLARLVPEPRRLACRGCGTQDTTLHFRCPQCGEWDSFA